ncbi:MAG: hypothetical protein VB980_01815 [Opitutales bacterium]
MNFNWRRSFVPLILATGLLLCFNDSPQTGLGASLVAFALIIGFSRGSSSEN